MLPVHLSCLVLSCPVCSVPLHFMYPCTVCILPDRTNKMRRNRQIDGRTDRRTEAYHTALHCWWLWCWRDLWELKKGHHSVQLGGIYRQQVPGNRITLRVLKNGSCSVGQRTWKTYSVQTCSTFNQGRMESKKMISRGVHTVRTQHIRPESGTD